MKKHGLLMTPDLAQKAYDRLKSVTRRVMDPQPKYIDDLPPEALPGEIAIVDGVAWRCSQYSQRQPDSIKWRYLKPRYRPGDIVSIKEYHYRYGHKEKNANGNWCFVPDPTHLSCVMFRKPHDAEDRPNALGYHAISGLYLHYDLARTHVEILDARPEPLWDITKDDVWAEGIDKDKYHEWLEDAQNVAPGGSTFEQPIDLFHAKWDSINGKKHPWAGNDWIWRYLFRKVDIHMT